LQIPTTEESTKPFPYPLPLDPNTKTLASIPLALFYPGVVALAAAAGMIGSTVGKGLPGELYLLLPIVTNDVTVVDEFESSSVTRMYCCCMFQCE
jgi:hypothetical protein